MKKLLFSCSLFFFTVCYGNEAIEYLNSIKTLRGYFVQYNPDRTESSGTLWLSVPGKLRIDYDDPPIALIINKGLLTYYDRKLDETSHTFIDKGDPILAVLAKPGAISTSEVTSEKDYILITRSDGDKKFTMKLTRNPVRLVSFAVDDYNSGVTELKFRDLSYNKNIDKKVFTEF